MSTPTPPTLSSRDMQRRAQFARAAVYLEFRHRDARALDYDDFRDRKPSKKPLLPPPSGTDAPSC